MLSSPLQAEGDGPPAKHVEIVTIGDLQVLGANHVTADLSIRGALSLTQDNIRDLTRRLRHGSGQELLAVSTCNRTEIYFVGICLREAIQVLSEVSGLDSATLGSVTYYKKGLDAVNHLFTVACGLNSAAVGESEILGQLKSAFGYSKELGSIGKLLQPLLQRTLRVSKRVRTESELGRRGMSVASLAVRRAHQISQGFRGKQILIVGAGQIAESVAKNLNHQGGGEVTVCSRTLSRAFTLAAIHGFNAVAQSQFESVLRTADVVFFAASVEQPILGSDDLDSNVKKGAVLIDLGVPANVSSAVRSHREVKLIDMDDLTQEVSKNISHVAEATPKAMAIVDEEVVLYGRECEEREASPSIEALVRRTEEVRVQNLEWALSQIPVENVRERKLVEDLTIRLMRGMISDPIRKLKSDFRDPAERATLARFFQAED